MISLRTCTDPTFIWHTAKRAAILTTDGKNNTQLAPDLSVVKMKVFARFIVLLFSSV